MVGQKTFIAVNLLKRISDNVRLGRRLLHDLLGRPGRKARGRLHDPAPPGRGDRPPGQVQGYGLPVHR